MLAVGAGGCLGRTPTGTGFPDGNARVLFVGNSLTYSNNLPSMFLALARMAGDTDVQASSIANPDYGLEDHWADGVVQRSLSEHQWEFVVMQQGSSALPASQVNLKTWTGRFAPLIRAAGAEPVLFMVWPFSSREFDFPNVLHSYREAAASVNGIFAPAGDAWTAFGSYALMYSGDGLHPSIYGTYVSALVLLERVRGISPEQLPPTIPGITASEETVRSLQAAARTALDRNPSRPRPDEPY
jgi:hypothetical protein